MVETLLVDMSAHQSETIRFEDVELLYQKGCRGLIVRVSRGPVPDPFATTLAEWGRDVGWPVGGYHFLEGKPDADGTYLDGTDQAALYLSAPATSGLDFHVLDVEAAGINWHHVTAFVAEMRRAGLRVGLYSNTGYWDRRKLFRRDIFDYLWWGDWRTKHQVTGEFIGGGSRWLGNWTSAPNAAPPAPLWQYGLLRFKSPTDGLNRGIDGNVFAGTVDELRAYVGAA